MLWYILSMSRKIFLSIIFVLTMNFVLSTGVLAKAPAKKTNVVVTSSVAKNKQSVSLYLANLQKTATVTYSLSYLTNGKSEGAGGTIKTKGKYSLSRILLFGTCSNKVCRYHKKIKDAVLTVVISFQNGTTVTKNFKLRV